MNDIRSDWYYSILLYFRSENYELAWRPSGMFGILRYILALMVVQTHLWKITPWAGNYAVFTFFVLSGYLMTLVLHERYSFGASGIVRFLANRSLRIYPPYWAVLILSVFVAYYLPHIASAVHRNFTLPATSALWIKNIIIIGAGHPTKATLVIPAWSLHIELIFYFLMAIGFSRNRFTVFLWIAASLAYTVRMSVLHPTEYHFWYYRYFPVQAGSLAFSAGAVIYFIRKRFTVRPALALATTALAVGFMIGAGHIWKDIDRLYLQGFYLSLAFGFLTVLALGGMNSSSIPAIIKTIDRRLGGLSYPLFLCHVPVAALVLHWYGAGLYPNTARFFIMALVTSHVAAIIVRLAIESPVNRLRNSVRGDAKDPEGPLNLEDKHEGIF